MINQKTILSALYSAKTFLGVCLTVGFIFTSCGDDDGPVDPRVAFAGSYEIFSNHNVGISQPGFDTTLLVKFNSEINFKIDPDLDSDELKVELEEFIEDIFEGIYSTGGISISATVGIDEDDLVAIISDNDLEVDQLEFNMTLIIPGNEPLSLEGEFSIEGELDGNIMMFDYNLTYFLPSEPLYKSILKGEVEGEK